MPPALDPAPPRGYVVRLFTRDGTPAGYLSVTWYPDRPVAQLCDASTFPLVGDAQDASARSGLVSRYRLEIWSRAAAVAEAPTA